MATSEYTPSQKDITHFWSRVNVTPDPDECWLWEGKPGNHGYGQIGIGNKKGGLRFTSHRFSWIVNNGPIPQGLWVLHTCDNRICCNPNHLFLGTAKDNTDDMIRKNRHTKGEEHPSHKLSDDQVSIIRMMYASGKASQSELGKHFGVTQSLIGCIVRRDKWKHI